MRALFITVVLLEAFNLICLKSLFEQLSIFLSQKIGYLSSLYWVDLSNKLEGSVMFITSRLLFDMRIRVV